MGNFFKLDAPKEKKIFYREKKNKMVALTMFP
jgi:hypothetical protein